MIQMSREDWDLWSEHKPEGNTVTHVQLKVISELHARYFNHKFNIPCGCDKKLVNSWIKDLNRIYESGYN